MAAELGGHPSVRCHAALDPTRPKYYVLEMFPYPSGRIHMGHVRNYTIGDVMARYKRMRGFNVLHPMGWDAFGLPAENAAIKTGIHPAKWTYDNIALHEGPAQAPGLSATTGTARSPPATPTTTAGTSGSSSRCSSGAWPTKKTAPVNWCPSCQTVLANEQVEDGVCWRCDTERGRKGAGAVVLPDHRLRRRAAARPRPA